MSENEFPPQTPEGWKKEMAAFYRSQGDLRALEMATPEQLACKHPAEKWTQGWGGKPVCECGHPLDVNQGEWGRFFEILMRNKHRHKEAA